MEERIPIAPLVTQVRRNVITSSSFNRIFHYLGAAILIEKIQDTRTELAKLKLSKTIPVGNSDAGFYFNLKVLAASDFGVSPYFSSRVIDI